MLELIHKLTDYIGIGNIITIITFIISVIVAYYAYFKTFYRLVYSTQTICRTCETFADWKNEEKELNTRIIIFNNGRKTISKQKIEKLEIISTNKIKEVLLIRSIGNLSVSIENNTAKIHFEYLDSSDFVVLEVIHNGNIILDGRIEETGKLLHTEPKNWVIINAVIIISLTLLLFYNMFRLLDGGIIQLFSLLTTLLFTYGIIIVLRFIHKLFFIPDSITTKYVNSKDKWNTEFNN